jgi:hypothetical protein
VRRLDHVVLDVRPEAVLRAEDGGERHTVGASEAIDHVAKLVID